MRVFWGRIFWKLQRRVWFYLLILRDHNWLFLYMFFKKKTHNFMISREPIIPPVLVREKNK